MTVTVDSITPLGAGSYKSVWSSDLANPLFYIWRDGRLMDTTMALEYTLYVSSGEQLVLEVFDSADDVASDAFPGKITLGWYPVADTAHYIIERLVNAVWVQKKQVNDTGLGFYQWQSDYLEDVTTHEFRIVPYGDNGNAGTALSFAVFMVRLPDVPDVSFSYDDSTNKVTIT